MNWEEKILTYLADNYRRSKKDSGDNRNNRRTQVKPEKLYKKYKANDGDFDTIDALNNTVNELISFGFITCDNEKFGTQIQNIYLVDEKIDGVEMYLNKNYGYVSKDMKRRSVLNIIERYKDASVICKAECARIKVELEKNKIPNDYATMPELLSVIAFLENNDRDLYIREVSMEVYGDSKYFEETTLEPVCKLLRKYGSKPCDSDQLLDEILLDYHVKKEPQKYCIKGNFVLIIDGKSVDFRGFPFGVEFDTGMLTRIDKIIINVANFITIENRTSYLRYSNQDNVTFYLGGYANRFQRDFIKKVCEDNPGVKCMHFGDIDAGGFWIHHNLCEITGVNFETFCMTRYELENSKFKKCLHQLTENDISRLQELRKIEQYSDTICYMLENNVKLEQEIVSLELAQDTAGILAL